jgi:hypothetical protein
MIRRPTPSEDDCCPRPQMKGFPEVSTATPVGSYKAAEIAGPPSPENSYAWPALPQLL